MADIMRPHTALGTYTPVEYVDTDVQIAGDYVLSPGFRQVLDDYLPKAKTDADKAKCLELLTSLNISDVIKESARDLPPDYYPYQPESCVPVQKAKHRRPKSAMAATPVAARIGPMPDTNNPYTTSYNRHYPERKGSEPHGIKPKTTGGRAFTARHDLSGPVGRTTYMSEFYGEKKLMDSIKNPMQPIRSGTASGTRNNNPHPYETFMVWKNPRVMIRDGEYGRMEQELTDEAMDKAVRGLLTSTYQNDYLGLPQGYPVEKLFKIKAPDWRSNVPYTLSSDIRVNFTKPVQQKELKNTVGRYTSNKDRFKVARGIAPTVPKRHMLDLKTRTTYECQYSDPLGPKPAEVRSIAKLHADDAIRRSLANGGTFDVRALRNRQKPVFSPQPPAPTQEQLTSRLLQQPTNQTARSPTNQMPRSPTNQTPRPPTNPRTPSDPASRSGYQYPMTPASGSRGPSAAAPVGRGCVAYDLGSPLVDRPDSTAADDSARLRNMPVVASELIPGQDLGEHGELRSPLVCVF